MLMPTPLYHLLTRWAARFPVPQGEPGDAFEETCRQWTTRFIQQAAFQYPYEGYGAKRAGEGRPLSKDVIARFGPPLIGWDVLVGAGTGAPVLIDGPKDSIDLTGQIYEPVQPQDYLRDFPPGVDPGPEPGPPPGPDPEPPTTPDCSQCALLKTGVEALLALRDGLETIKSELASANEQRQVTISELARICSRLEATPTMEQLTKNPVLVKFRW